MVSDSDPTDQYRLEYHRLATADDGAVVGADAVDSGTHGRLPAMTALSDMYECVVELAGERLMTPITVDITCWTDGEAEIRAWNSPWGQYKDVIRAKSDGSVYRYVTTTDRADGAVWIDELTDEVDAQWAIDTEEIVVDLPKSES